ncbi:MAG: hypothetical protein QM582_11145 [Micropruina sp.]|uniref:hypothetical protein n=1 Tax=Micropruina sp. TaxID=2737536 RepID=UPI0039E70232
MKQIVDLLTGGSTHHQALLTALGFLCGLFTTQGRPMAGLTLGVAAVIGAAALFPLKKAPRTAWTLAGLAIGVAVSFLLTSFGSLGS